MRTIGLAVIFLLASAFGALAAEAGAPDAGTAPRAHQTMQHKTMHHGTARRHRSSAYRHGHRKVYGSSHYRTHATAMHHRAGPAGTRKASKTPVKGTQNKGKTSTY
jgi:hypothetical protein